MKNKTAQMDIGIKKSLDKDFVLFEKIISDRGSKYSVSAGRVKNREDIKAFLKRLKSNKKYAKATHNTWAASISKDGIIYETKSDDGETGAGNVMLRIVNASQYTDVVVCVTRWFGGVKLEGDRFKHVQNATKYLFDNL